MTTPTRADLTSAMRAAHQAVGNLRSALASANPVTALLLYPMIGSASQLQAKISALIDALNAAE